MTAAVLEPTAVRLAGVRDRIANAAQAAGREPDEVRLLAVSKTHDPGSCLAVAAAGVADLGENRVQELLGKANQLQDAPVDLRWHLIGPLQSNKAQKVVDLGIWIHTVDRTSLVERLARVAERPEEQVVLVQVNVDDDPAKAGCTPDEAPRLVERAVEVGLDVRGLMTIPALPPAGADPVEAARPAFARLRELRDRIRLDHPGVVELSMGMSADLEAAVAEGATIVRVGTAIFGERGDAPWRPPG